MLSHLERGKTHNHTAMKRIHPMKHTARILAIAITAAMLAGCNTPSALRHPDIAIDPVTHEVPHVIID